MPWFGQTHALDCEAASLQMMLAYEGVSATQDQILAAMGDDPRRGYYDSNGTLRWGNAYQVFVGNVDGSELDLTGYGTYWPVVARVANQIGGGSVYQAGAGISPSTVYSLVAAGHPVQAWVTFNWQAPGSTSYLSFDGTTWLPWAGPDEHSVVVMGVSDTSVEVSDPDGGKGIPGHNYPQQYWIAKSTFEAAYHVYGDMAVAIGRAPAAPVAAACAGQGSASVSWTLPDAYGARVTGFSVTMQPGSVTQQMGAGARFATFTGLSPGTAYTFSVTASDMFGTSDPGDGGGATPWAGPASATSYFTWYDHASPGMLADNLHLVAGAGGSTTSQGCITIAGAAVLPFSISPGSEGIFNFPAGVIGGPVQLSLFQGNPLTAAQRVQYYQSFNEVPAQPAGAAATSLQFAWYDHRSSPGFLNDNIHVLNPGTGSASVTVAIPGCPAQSQPSLAAGAEAIFSCGDGFGGPVTVTASAPVLASQRVQYYQSFNEEWAQDPTKAATTLQFAWYDRMSDSGFAAGNDNIHVWNPAGAGTATGTVAIPGCPGQALSIAARAEQIFSCSNGIGGPVTITASAPVLASQREQYYQSFNEVPGLAAGAAGTSLSFAWYDHVSNPGFRNDNVHVWDPAGGAFTVQVQIPGCPTQSAQVAAGQEAILSCPNGYGGPVLITSSVAVLAAQRVQYFDSFNETPAS